MASITTRLRAGWRVFKNGYPAPPRIYKAKSPDSPYSWGGSTTPTWTLRDATAYIEAGFNINTIIYDCVMYKARALTAAPLRAYTGDPEAPTVLVPPDPLALLVNRPNPFQSWTTFHQQSIIMLNVTGNSFMLALRPKATGLPSGLFNLRSDRVKIIPGEGGIKGYVYVPEGKKAEDGLPILPEDMIHIKFPNPADALEGLGYGMSPVAPMAQSADVDNAVTAFLRLFFQNGTQLPGLLKFPNPLNPDDIGVIKDRWRELYGGFENWNDIGVIDQGADYVRVAPTFNEMGFDGIDERNEARMHGPFGVPPILVGARLGLKHATYANFKEARLLFWQDTMTPELALYQSELEYRLTDDNTFVRFDTSAVPAFRESVLMQVDGASKLWAMGVPANSALATVGLRIADIPAGDEGFIPTSVAPASAVVSGQTVTPAGTASAHPALIKKNGPPLT